VAVCRIQLGKKMPELELEEARELLIGTWIGVALLAEALTERGVISKEELLFTLSQAEEAASNKRRTALAGLRLLISRGFRCGPCFAVPKSRAAPRRSRNVGGCRESSSFRPADARSHQSLATGNFRMFVDMGVDKRHRQK
jgi:hypothetical protein